MSKRSYGYQDDLPEILYLCTGVVWHVGGNIVCLGLEFIVNHKDGEFRAGRVAFCLREGQEFFLDVLLEFGDGVARWVKEVELEQSADEECGWISLERLPGVVDFILRWKMVR